jgi:hypothetical protein
MATLRHLDLQPFDTAPVDTGPGGRLPAAVPGARWIVLVGQAGPVSAIAPGTTLESGARPPAILVAAADLDISVIWEAAAFREFAGVSALVLIEPGAVEAGETGIAGVVSGQALSRLMLRGPMRGLTGPVLPGAPAIPLIARSCGYLESGAACVTPMSFTARPYPMPDCPNDRGLTAHPFVW